MTREQIATHSYTMRRASANNGLPYRQSPTQVDDDLYDDVWPPPMPTSARRYAGATTQGNTRYQFHPDQVQPIRRQKAPQGARTTEHIPAQQKKGGLRLLWLGIGMLLMLAGWIGLSTVLSWWYVYQVDATYGRLRTAQ